MNGCLDLLLILDLRYTEFPKAWELELASLSAPSPSPTNPVGEDDDESDKSDDEDDHEHEQEDLIDQKDDSMDSKDSKTNESTQPHSIAYREFLHFLELGCNGSPSQGYPAVVIILSTIPSSVRHFFLAFVLSMLLVSNL